MKCSEFSPMIDKILDDELSYKEKELYKQHIDQCPNCKKELEEILLLEKNLEGLEMIDVPVDFTDKVINKAKADGLIKSKHISFFSKFSALIASFLFLFLLLDFTVTPFLQEQLPEDNDFEIQQNQVRIMDLEIENVSYQDDIVVSRTTRNAALFIIAVVLSTPILIGLYKKRNSY